MEGKEGGNSGKSTADRDKTSASTIGSPRVSRSSEGVSTDMRATLPLTSSSLGEGGFFLLPKLVDGEGTSAFSGAFSVGGFDDGVFFGRYEP